MEARDVSVSLLPDSPGDAQSLASWSLPSGLAVLPPQSDVTFKLQNFRIWKAVSGPTRFTLAGRVVYKDGVDPFFSPATPFCFETRKPLEPAANVLLAPEDLAFIQCAPHRQPRGFNLLDLMREWRSPKR
jgi:hypothetical protein